MHAFQRVLEMVFRIRFSVQMKSANGPADIGCKRVLAHQIEIAGKQYTGNVGPRASPASL